VKNQWLQAHVALFVVATLYGINYSIVKLVTPAYILPFGFIGIRILLGTVVFWVLAAGNGDRIHWKRDGWRFIASGITGVGINMLLFFKGISLTSATNGSLIMTLIPLFVFGFSIVILKEKIIPLRLLGLIVGLVGAGIIIWQSDPALKSNPVGDLMIIGNALSYSLYLVLVRPLMDHYKLLTVTKWAFLIGLIFSIPFSIKEALIADYGSFTSTVWWSIAFVVIGVTVIVYFLNIFAMKKSSPTLVAAYAYLQPIVAILTASLFFDEKLSIMHLLGGALIFSGIYLVSRFRPQSTRP
jgi:drug/metabolite transporter (DMT)-like permease